MAFCSSCEQRDDEYEQDLLPEQQVSVKWATGLLPTLVVLDCKLSQGVTHVSPLGQVVNHISLRGCPFRSIIELSGDR